MTSYRGAERFLPERRSLGALRSAVQECRGCPLYRRATQAVFGKGPARARIMMVGEQPGNDEDLAGAPFVGPAGKLLDHALHEARIDRSDVYLTNAVKHFKWEPSGSKRLHKKPDHAETLACSPWVHSEIAAVRPDLLICLGATAAQSLLGRAIRVTTDRGRAIPTELAPIAVATIHPSAILRQRTSADRARELAAFVADLEAASGLLRALR